MTYNQTTSNLDWPGERRQARSQRGLHKSVSRDDAWHSVWKRIERAEPVRPAASVRDQRRIAQPPRDYVVDLDV